MPAIPATWERQREGEFKTSSGKVSEILFQKQNTSESVG
jgi:hypothetical protein